MISERHKTHHELIERRVAKTKDGSTSRLQWREDIKKAVWTITGHLQSEHGFKAPSSGVPIQQLLNIHDRLHEEEG